MCKLDSFVALMVISIWCASVCHVAEVANAKLSPGALQKLRAPVSREAVVGALLANPETKSVLTEAASKRGIAADRISAIVRTPLPSLATSPARAPSAAPSGDTQLRSLNWAGGLTFTPFTVPIYGTGNWRVGVIYAR